MFEVPLVCEDVQEKRPISPDLDANIQYLSEQFEEQKSNEDVQEVYASNIEVDNISVYLQGHIDDIHAQNENIGVNVKKKLDDIHT